MSGAAMGMELRSRHRRERSGCGIDERCDDRRDEQREKQAAQRAP